MKCVPRLCKPSTRNTSLFTRARIWSFWKSAWISGFWSVLSMMLIPEAPAPGRGKPVKGSAKFGAKGGNWPVSGSMKNVFPARTSTGRARPSRPRSREMISSVTRS